MTLTTAMGLALFIAAAVIVLQWREHRRLDQTISHLMDDNLKDFEGRLQARTDAEYWKRQAFQANMIVAALCQYPSDDDDPLTLDTSDPRNGAGTRH